MMDPILTSVLSTLVGTLSGVWLGYRLSLVQANRIHRRTVLRDIAFEYRRLGDIGKSGHVQGLIQAGIYQCQTNEEYRLVLDLATDIARQYPVGEGWQPTNERFVEFFTRLRKQQKDPTNGHQMTALKEEVERLPSKPLRKVWWSIRGRARL